MLTIRLTKTLFCYLALLTLFDACFIGLVTSLSLKTSKEIMRKFSNTLLDHIITKMPTFGVSEKSIIDNLSNENGTTNEENQFGEGSYRLEWRAATFLCLQTVTSCLYAHVQL